MYTYRDISAGVTEIFFVTHLMLSKCFFSYRSKYPKSSAAVFPRHLKDVPSTSQPTVEPSAHMDLDQAGTADNIDRSMQSKNFQKRAVFLSI